MPNREFNVLGLKFNLNPCPFNMKEHTIIVRRIPGAAVVLYHRSGGKKEKHCC